jgi:hypothetical protein
VRAPLAIAIALALFFPAFFADDSFNVLQPGEVSAVYSFLRTASPGRIYTITTENAPLADTARYNQFPESDIFGRYGIVDTAAPGVADEIANDALSYTQGSEPAYVVVTPSMLAYMRAYGMSPSNGPTVLLQDLAQSSSWELVLHRSGVWIYELPPTAPPITAGSGGRGHVPLPSSPVQGNPHSILSTTQSLDAIAQLFSRQLGRQVSADQVMSTTYAYQHGLLSADLRAYMNAQDWSAPTPAGQHFWA